MIDNLDKIIPLLNFELEGDFITVLVLKRKKDLLNEPSNHQSVRTIKSYTFYSIDSLKNRYDEIKLLCEVFKARAYIHFNVKNDKSIAIRMISQLATNIETENYSCKNVYDSVVGSISSRQKRWIIDIDKENLHLKPLIQSEINSLPPFLTHTDKIITEIPTKSGIHLITYPFRLDKFSYSNVIDVQKNNPTVLYIPKSLC